MDVPTRLPSTTPPVVGAVEDAEWRARLERQEPVCLPAAQDLASDALLLAELGELEYAVQAEALPPVVSGSSALAAAVVRVRRESDRRPTSKD